MTRREERIKEQVKCNNNNNNKKKRRRRLR
jgi:hypothetical protein